MKNILICGVGGQGIILASKLLSEVALNSGLDVKQSEVHGMSQRGGSVVSYVRIGKKIYSPLINFEKTDFILAFEKLESLKYLKYSNKKTKILVNNFSLVPGTVNSGKFDYPEVQKETENLDIDINFYNINELAHKLGNYRVSNTLMLGILSNFLDIPKETWVNTIKQYLPEKILDVNLKAFSEGQNLKSL